MDETAIKMPERQVKFLKNLLDNAIKYMVEVEVKTNDRGTYWVQFPTIREGVPIIEKFLANTPFYIEALLLEVNRLRDGIKKVTDMSTQSGPAEKLLHDIETFSKELLSEEEVKPTQEEAKA
jgi:hypothetical protein